MINDQCLQCFVSLRGKTPWRLVTFGMSYTEIPMRLYIQGSYAIGMIYVLIAALVACQCCFGFPALPPDVQSPLTDMSDLIAPRAACGSSRMPGPESVFATYLRLLIPLTNGTPQYVHQQI